MAVDPEAEVWTDVAEFEELADVPLHQPGVVGAWERAAALWRGRFLEGFDPVLGEEWETWLLGIRNRLDARAVALLDRLADLRERSGEQERALDLTRRLLEIDRWHDPAQIRLLRVLGRMGRTGEALTHAEALIEALADELGVEPTAKLTAAIRALRNGEFTDRVDPVPGLPPQRGVRAADVCVAREEELAWLGRCLEDALSGSGRLVFLSGPVGSGKSVLLRSFAAEARQWMPDLAVFSGNCNACAGPGDPYLPFRQVLGLLCGDLDDPWTRGQLTPREASLLWTGVPEVVEALVDDGPDLLATLIDGTGLLRRFESSHPDDPRLGTLRAAVEEASRRAAEPGRAPQPLLDQCVRVLTRIASHRPMLLAIDDAHWADTGTIDLLRHLSEHVTTAPVLVVVAFRPYEMPHDERRADPMAMLTQEVQAHSSAECVCQLRGTRSFVDAWLDTEPNRLDESFRDRLYRTTGGHALFTVETVAAMQGRGDLVRDAGNRWVTGDSVAWQEVPPRVEAAVAARTNALPTQTRRDLETASVQGRDFFPDVVALARGSAPREVDSRLAELTAAAHPLVEFLGTTSVGGRRLNRYCFRHDVFRQTLEDGLGAPDRARLHEATGRAMADLFAEQLDEIAVDLARHFDAADLPGEAIAAHERAGRRAMRLSATAEAIAHLRRAVQLLDQQEASPEREVAILGLLSALGTCLQARAGYNAPETDQVYERVRALIPIVGPTMESAEALGPLIAVDGLRARYGAANEGAERLLALARTFEAAPIEAVAHAHLGWMALMTARLGDAERHLDRVVEMYEADWDPWLTETVGFHVAATALTWRALVHWYRGRPDRSRQDADTAIELARGAHSPFSLVFALQVAGSTVHEHLREGEKVIDFSTEAGTVAEREGFAFYTAASRLHHGLGSCYLGDLDRGLADLEEGLARWADLGTLAFRAWITAVNLQFYLADDRLDAGERALHSVERWVAEGEEELAGLWLPLARAQVLRARGDNAAAERELGDRLSFLVAAGAHGVALRTATALAEVLCDRGRHDEAVAALVPALAAVEGGEDTSDVIEARDVLERAGRWSPGAPDVTGG